jgi:hypothetical protein
MDVMMRLLLGSKGWQAAQDQVNQENPQTNLFNLRASKLLLQLFRGAVPGLVWSTAFQRYFIPPTPTQPLASVLDCNKAHKYWQQQFARQEQNQVEQMKEHQCNQHPTRNLLADMQLRAASSRNALFVDAFFNLRAGNSAAADNRHQLKPDKLSGSNWSG